MSKLPNAPLVEVIFEIKWDITNKSDIVDFQYLHGDLYSHLKGKYPHRENLVSPEVPFDIVRGIPVFRYRESNNSYPLVQIGPGLITVNTTDSKYFWDEFRNEANNVLFILSEIYPKYRNLTLSPILIYIDFFELDKTNCNSFEFINTNFQLHFSENFIHEEGTALSDLNFTFNYKFKDDILSLNIRDGKINKNKEGIVLQTKVIGKKEKYSKNELESWLDNAHELSSKTFKSLTKGDLYETFK
jgi:uncharacterized protein (TIGR04255 family)